jgi:tRNA(His) 5'-end guanylyltransferase
MNDDLSIRMKEQYENRTRYFLPRRTFTILRLDGKAFHTYTRGLKKPFDNNLSEDIDNAIIAMLPEIQGAVFAYTQSDEISILLTDFATPQTDMWFDGNIQKISSVAASIMTAEFNRLRYKRWATPSHVNVDSLFGVNEPSLAYFDCRTFTIPDRVEVMNYFRWRQQDCVRNSVSMVAQANFSHKELHGKSQSMMHEMLHQKGVNWATDFTDGEKNGRVIMKESYNVKPLFESGKQMMSNLYNNGEKIDESIPRTRWVSNGAWVFTKDEGKLLTMIPNYSI